MSGAHAKFSPSGAHRWMECTGSMLLEASYPNTSSKFADEGTAAHFLAAECLQSGKNASDHAGKKIAVPEDGEPFFSPEGQWTVTEDFASAVQVYLNDVRDRAAGGDLFIEQRLELSRTLGVSDQFGTSDAVVAHLDKKHLTVADLKFGRGEQVYAEKNHQLQLYALGVLETLDIVYGGGAFEFITLVVCQPRLDWIDEWTVSYTELLDFRNRARGKVDIIRHLTANPENMADRPHLYFNPGDKTCRWCKAKADCPALAQVVSKAMLDEFDAIDRGVAAAMTPPAQHLASDEVLGRRMAVVDLVMEWAKAVRAEGEKRVFEGRTILGSDGLPMKIVEGKRGNRAWADPKLAESHLAGHLPPDKLYYPPELVSVSDAEKAIGKKQFQVLTQPADPERGVPAGPLSGLVHQAPGKPSVALGSDKRPALSLQQVSATDFDEDDLCK